MKTTWGSHRLPVWLKSVTFSWDPAAAMSICHTNNGDQSEHGTEHFPEGPDPHDFTAHAVTGRLYPWGTGSRRDRLLLCLKHAAGSTSQLAGMTLWLF